MALFKSIEIRESAENIAKGFFGVREQHFQFIARELSKRFEQKCAGDLPLQGEADTALKGFQLFLYLSFSMAHPYLSGKADKEFSAFLFGTVMGTNRGQIESHLGRYFQLRNSYAELLAEVAFPVAQKITPELDPRAVSMTANLLRFFAMNTQMIIAEVFHDCGTADQLSTQMNFVYDEMGDGEGANLLWRSQICPNCCSSFQERMNCCAICGIPLI